MAEMPDSERRRDDRKSSMPRIGVSSVTARRENSSLGVKILMKAVVALCRCSMNINAYNLHHHYEPPYTEPYVRWCGRTAGGNPPPTR